MNDYEDFLKDAISNLCNANGAYEVWWDCGDRVEPSQVRAAVQEFESAGYASPQAYLECVTFQDAAIYHQDEFLKELGEMAEQSGGEVAREYRRALDEGTIWDDLDRSGYKGVDLMMESALSQSRIDVNLLFATEEELNRDTCSIVDAFGSSCSSPRAESLDAGDLDNALSYLVNQQGYSITDLYAALDDAMIDSTFIQTAADEVDENSSECTSCLVALLATDALTYIELCGIAGKEGHDVILPKSDCTIGIFDKEQGCGGALGICPERDVVMPSELIFEVQAERAGGTLRDGYTVDQAYGLVPEAWRPSIALKEGGGPIKMEKFDEVLDAMRLGLEELAEGKPTESREVNACAIEPSDGPIDLGCGTEEGCKTEGCAR